MASSRSIAKVNKMMPFEVSILNDPVVVSSSTGVITDINQQFQKTFGWTHDELIGQNCHLLIPSKFVRKSAHDRKLKGYSFGRESPIIGKSRIVPVATPDDGEVLVNIKIIPIRSKKEFCFMVLFDKIDFDRRFYDFAVEFKSVRAKIKKLSKTEDFREDSIESSLIVKDISRLFAKELEVIGDFIVENRNSRSVLPMTKHFLLHTPIGNLGSLRKEMEKVFDNNNISFLNICCLRIIFPSILRRVDLPFLNELKLSLYEEESESSLTGTL
mmetsp:Transcript_21313/g.36492  ORF Transcript_21313/g.36492 Transcript_21313/m.36492 type:complete len:271 (-) Transcript_21313:67-879(-)